MTEFARKQLEKYGWCEGKGLGKEENGIAKPIRAKLKFDNHGIGHDSSQVLTSRWWCDVFNDASKRISVTKNETGVEIHTEIKAVESALPSNLLVHKTFIKAEKLENDKELSSLKENSSDTSVPDIMTDEVLYRKCEGMKKNCFNYSLMKGKINRIKRQDDEFIEKSAKKKKKSKRRKYNKEEN